MWKLGIFFVVTYLNCVCCRHLTRTQSEARTINQPMFINSVGNAKTTSIEAKDQSIRPVSVSTTTPPNRATTPIVRKIATTESEEQVEKLVANPHYRGENYMYSQNNRHEDEVESTGLNNVNGASDMDGGGYADDFNETHGDDVGALKEIDGHRDEETGGYQDEVIVDDISDSSHGEETGSYQDEEMVEELSTYPNEEMVDRMGVLPDELLDAYKDKNESKVGDLEIDHGIQKGMHADVPAVETNVEVFHSEIAVDTEQKDSIDNASTSSHVSSAAQTQANVNEQVNKEDPKVEFQNSIHQTTADHNDELHSEESHINTATAAHNPNADDHSGPIVHNVSEKADASLVDSVNNVNEENNVVPTITTTTIKPFTRATTTRDPDDVDPLDIFVDDIRYQRFPTPMEFETFKRKILDRPFKKLYVLEETDKKLFSHVRQLQARYTMEGDTLYVSFLFRFIFSRKCQEIKRFKLGKHVGNTNKAYFEKELDDGVTERIIFFSEIPEDYVYFVSCSDRKTSPYACRDKYYVTLDSVHDPPNQFPWLIAAEELRRKMDLSFNDPRFVFNFVMMPCARV